MFNRSTLIILAAAAAIAGLLAGKHWFDLRHAPAAGPALQAVQLFDAPREVPAFNLRQSDGTPLVNGELKGHWTVVFIGFTHCPDVCPTTLAQLKQAQNIWQQLPENRRPRVLFVSVDPERDTPMRVGEYARAFHADSLAATADVPALEGFTRSLSLVFMKQPPAEGDPKDRYPVDHSASLAVLDPQARMAGVIMPPFNPQAIADDLLKLTENNNGAAK